MYDVNMHLCIDNPETITYIVGDFQPHFCKIFVKESNWIISPKIRGENKKYLKLPPSMNVDEKNLKGL